MVEREPEVEYITLAVERTMKPVAMSKLAELAADNIIEIVEPPKTHQYTPGFVEWLGPVGSEVAVITGDSLRYFTSQTSSKSKAGTEIINKIRLAARTNTDLQRYLYYEPGESDATGVLADTFDELSDRLGVDDYSKATLNVDGIGHQWLRTLKKFRSKYRLPQS